MARQGVGGSVRHVVVDCVRGGDDLCGSLKGFRREIVAAGGLGGVGAGAGVVGLDADSWGDWNIDVGFLVVSKEISMGDSSVEGWPVGGWGS